MLRVARVKVVYVRTQTNDANIVLLHDGRRQIALFEEVGYVYKKKTPEVLKTG